MITRIILIFLLVGNFSSDITLYNGCKQKNIRLLTNDSIKYWSDIWKKPYFENYKEGGLAFSKDSILVEYHTNSDMERSILRGSDDVICTKEKFWLRGDTLFIKRCGFESVLKIVKLTEDSLELKEVTMYNFFPDLGKPIGSIPIIYVKSKDQITKPIVDHTDYQNGPIKMYPANK